MVNPPIISFLVNYSQHIFLPMKRGKYQKYECIKIVTTKMQESSDYSLAVGQSPRSLAAGFPLYSICRSSI